MAPAGTQKERLPSPGVSMPYCTRLVRCWSPQTCRALRHLAAVDFTCIERGDCGFKEFNAGWAAHTLAHESFPLFRNLGAAAFEDVTARSGVGPATLARSGWGNGIVDLNNDGWRDLFAACADVMDPAGAFRERVPMASAVLVNLKDGRFADGSAGAGEDFARKAQSYDEKQLAEVYTSYQRRLHESGALDFDDLIMTTASGTRYAEANTAVGYGSASDRRVHLGLGADDTVTELTVTWPSGKVQTLNKVKADQVLTVREPDQAALTALP